MLFENLQPTFDFLFRKKNKTKQFDANSCGVWLVAAMSSYLINLPEISDRYNAFEIAYNFLERNPIIQKVESLYTNDTKKSEYFRQSLLKGIRTNFFFITDISKTSISDINAGDNGAYLKSCNTNKFYYCDRH